VNGDYTATLVLVTGDGNDNGKTTSFPRTVMGAIKQGWNVEVVAWKQSLSSAYVLCHVPTTPHTHTYTHQTTTPLPLGRVCPRLANPAL
jgi:hypothetical protein